MSFEAPSRVGLLCPSCDSPLNFETAKDVALEKICYKLSCPSCVISVKHVVDAVDLIDVGSAARFDASVCSDLFSQMKAYVGLRDTEAVDELVNAGMIEPTTPRDINDDAAIISGATF